MIPAIPATDDAAARLARHRQDTLTKPSGALGRLEDLSVWCAAVQGQCPPHAFRQPTLVIIAGDHGVSEIPGISAYPADVTAQMVLNFIRGGAAANVLARQHSVRLHVVDISVRSSTDYLAQVPEYVREFHVTDASGRIDSQDAITHECAIEAFIAGLSISSRLAAEGADLLIVGDMGIGNTTIAATVIAHFTSRPAHEVVGTGTGVDERGLQIKGDVINAALARMSKREGIAAMAIGGSADLIAMCGVMLGCIERKIPILLDGVVSVAAAVAIESMAPGARNWMIAAHRSTEPAQTIGLDHLNCQPILDLGMRLGEGSGALTALPIIQSAAATLAQMATFDEARVSDRESP